MNWGLVLHNAFVACCVMGILFSIAAHRHLAPEEKNTFRVLFWRRKDEFTSKGWRFRQMAVVFCYLGCAVALGQLYA